MPQSPLSGFAQTATLEKRLREYRPLPNVDILPWRSPSCILPFPDGVRFLEDAFRGPRINVAKESTRRASGKGHERLQGASPRNAVVRNEDEDEPEEERREEEE
ncbi:hypothetical protein V1477_005019 [Vespula maculifrons]|uniref:Uncharacterized protein n=2 Tax=Vespula TaxID=7451 RepID=A0A834U057_VESGE|nr:hypothetical protein HZH68_002444 [Vespula germanica]